MHIRERDDREATPDLLEVVGEGSTAVVWRGWLDGRVVAVKVAHDGSAAERLRREAERARRISHPRVLTTSGCLELPQGVAVVMPYLPGGSLADRLDRTGPLTPPVAARVLAHVADGLAAIHRAGLLHRDVKPRNVLFDAEGDAVIGDLGSAVEVASDAGSPVAEGSPAYLAPEVLAGHAPSVASDLYALGVTAYEALTGRLPETDREPALAATVPGLPADVVSTVEACLRATPAERPTSGAAVAAVFHEAAEALRDWTPDADAALAAWSSVDDPRSTRTFGPRPPAVAEEPTAPRGPSRAQLVATAAALFVTPIVAAGVLG